MKKNKCIICGNDLKVREGKFVPFLINRMFNNNPIETKFLTCKNCKFSYSSVRPSQSEMIRYYQNYMKEEYINDRERFEPGFKAWRNEYDCKAFDEELLFRKQNLSKIINKNISLNNIKTVLDYGGDRGQFIPDEFENTERYVYEISNVKPINNTKSINENELPMHNWDFIMCCHVLEHVSHPLGIINQIKSLMHSNTILYIEVPYEDHWETNTTNNIKLIKEIIRRPRTIFEIYKGKNKEPIYIGEHINMFRENTFKKIFNSKYFDILNLSTNYTEKLFGQNRFISCLVKKK